MAGRLLPLLPPPPAGAFITVEDGWPTAARKDQRGRLVAVSEHGERVGQDHQHAKLSDAQVEAMRTRYEAGQDGELPAIGYRALARLFNVHRQTVSDIVNYRRRNVFPARWKRIDK